MDEQPDERALSAVVAELRRSRRYGALAEPTLRRVGASALRVEGPRVAAAVKRSKRALHEIYGAYLAAPPRYAELERRLRTAAAAGDDTALREELRRIMRHHASTSERLPALDGFYDSIFALTGPPASIVDVACGLNPLAAPWMRLADGVPYVALDIDAALVGFVDTALALLGVEHETRLADVLMEPPPAADVALVLKTIPCLEQQERGAGFALVDALDARAVVASFPTASLGGRSKGMARTYAESFEREAAARAWRWERVDVPGELVYVVWR